MAEEPTENYGLVIPESTDSMATVDTFLTNTWEALESAANPTIQATPPLPQIGDYEIGDRVYIQGPAGHDGMYLLISKDDYWGWIWRPIQPALSPWLTLSADVIMHADYELHPTHTLQVALDNKGNCYWRGAIRKKVLGLPDADSLNIFRSFPDGLINRCSGMYTIATHPTTPLSDVGLGAYKGGRLYIQNDGYNSFRFHNCSTSQDIYLYGIEYPTSKSLYYNP